VVNPARLAGFGPIPAAMARDLAAHGTWTCAGIDDTHGTVLGLGQGTWRAGYTPGQRLRRLAAATHRRCSVPGCRARATRCDLDHAIAWPDGPTCACNLHPVCRRHHRMKTTGRLRVKAAGPPHPPGTWIWTTRTGRRYLASPPPVLPVTGHPDGNGVPVGTDATGTAGGTDATDGVAAAGAAGGGAATGERDARAQELYQALIDLAELTDPGGYHHPTLHLIGTDPTDRAAALRNPPRPRRAARQATTHRSEVSSLWSLRSPIGRGKAFVHAERNTTAQL
jgi:hypothetical protein